MPGRGQGHGGRGSRSGRGRSRSRGRPRKNPTPPPLPSSSEEEDTDPDSHTSIQTEHTKNYTSDASLNNFMDEMTKTTAEEEQLSTIKQKQTLIKYTNPKPNQSNPTPALKDPPQESSPPVTKNKDIYNPHSAQTKLNHFLSKPAPLPHTNRMKELQDIAAAKAPQRLEKAKSNTHKKKSKTTSKTKSKNSVNIDEENDSSSDAASEKNDNEKKKIKVK